MAAAAPPEKVRRPVLAFTAHATASEGAGGAARVYVSAAHAPPPAPAVLGSTARGPLKRGVTGVPGAALEGSIAAAGAAGPTMPPPACVAL